MINIQSAFKNGWFMSHRSNEAEREVIVKEQPTEETDKFRVYLDIEILYILRSMMRANALATLSFDNDNGFVLTTIIGINSKRGEVIFDYGTDEISNRRALRASKLNAFAILNRVEIQFVCHDIEKIKFEGRSAFSARIPDSLLRLRKRAHYRIDIPSSKELTCMIPTPQGEYASVLLQNISRGGVAVFDPDRKINFENGIDYQGCLIDLPGVGTVNVNLKVKSVSEMTQPSGLKCQRAGFEFASDTEERVLSMVQRYVNNLQMERKKAH